MGPDFDLELMDRTQLKYELRKARAAIRNFLKASGQYLCDLNRQTLINVLPEAERAEYRKSPTVVPTPLKFVEACVAYRKMLETGPTAVSLQRCNRNWEHSSKWSMPKQSSWQIIAGVEGL